jgi:hypothetical protein
MVQPYRPQIAPGATTIAPRMDAADFGAGIGASLTEIGGNMAQRQLRQTAEDRQREQTRQQAQAMADFAQLTEQTELAANEARQQAAPGGAGHRQAMEQLWDQRATEFLSTITDEEVRGRMQAQVAAQRGRFVVGEDAWERGRTVAFTVDKMRTAVGTVANRVARLPNIESYAEERDALTEQIASLPIDATARAAFEREALQQVDVAFLTSRPPQETLAILGSGFYDDKLTPEQRERVQQSAEVEMRRAQVEADARARADRATAQEEIDGIQRLIADGVPVPPERLEAAQQMAQTHGLAGDAYDIAKARVRDRVNRTYQQATPMQIENDLRELDGQIARAGDRVDPAQVIARDQMRTILEQRSAQIDDDPASFGASIGIDYGAIDFADPASVQARVRAAQATANATGRPAAYLLPTEVAQLQAGMASAEGRRSALAAAQAFGSANPRAVIAIARQIAPQDTLFHHAATLRGRIGSDVLEGRRLIQGRTFTPPQGLDAAILAQGGQALSMLGTDPRNNTLAAARALYAQYSATDGDPGNDARLNQGLVTRVIRIASGGRMVNGEWRGGIGSFDGRTVRLPDNVSDAEFAQRLGRLPAATGLYTRTGEQIGRSALLRNYTPVRQSDGRYAFVDRRGGYALLEDQRTPGSLNLPR